MPVSQNRLRRSKSPAKENSIKNDEFFFEFEFLEMARFYKLLVDDSYDLFSCTAILNLNFSKVSGLSIIEICRNNLKNT